MLIDVFFYGDVQTATAVNAGFVVASSITFRDITTGNNGVACPPGYNLVTGRGSWTGTTP